MYNLKSESHTLSSDLQLVGVIVVILELLGPALQFLGLCPKSGQALVAIRAELAEVFQHFQLKELPVCGVVNGLGLPLLVGYHVIPGPQETHFLGHIGVVRVTIDAACDIRLLQDGGLHLVVVCGAAGRDFILEHIKGYNRFPKLTVSKQTCSPCSAHTDTPWVAITDQMYWKTLKKKI